MYKNTAVLCGLLLAAVFPAHAQAAAGEPSPALGREAENAVVKVFATMRRPDMGRPWTKEPQVEVSGSGVVIEGKRILTNAHVIAYASLVQVQANQAGDKVSATVAATAPDVDLALLALEDESFFATHAPLPRASALPHIKDPVLAYGYPTGGTTLSITKGIVSRIEFVPYSLAVSALRIQIDAAVNPGNSGGPAIAGDKMVGLVFSHLKSAENISYIIPNEEIELFLQQIASVGHYLGKPSMFGELQTLENPALRAYLKLDASVSGMVVTRMYEKAAAEALHQWDVITRIGDTPIDDQGMIRLGSDVRLSFAYLVQKLARNGAVPLTVVRAGRTLHVDSPVPDRHPLLVDSLRNEYPRYFIYGPLVFSTATLDFMASPKFRERSTASPLRTIPLLAAFGALPQPERTELVLIPSPLFPHRISKGYGDPSGEVLSTVNGTPVRSLAHLVALLRDLKDEFVNFGFDGRTVEPLVFRRAEVLASTEEILTDNGVRAQGSADLMKIWHGEAAP